MGGAGGVLSLFWFLSSSCGRETVTVKCRGRVISGEIRCRHRRRAKDESSNPDLRLKRKGATTTVRGFIIEGRVAGSLCVRKGKRTN